MEILTSDSLNEAGVTCTRFENYKVGIAFRDRVSLKNYVCEHLPPYYYLPREGMRFTFFGETVRIREASGSVYIDFSNGSRITLFVMCEAAKGYRYHKVIYDENISEHILQNILSHMQCLYFLSDGSSDRTPGSRGDSSYLEPTTRLKRDYILDANVLTNALTECSKRNLYKIQVLFSDEERFNDFRKGLAGLLAYELIPELHYISDSISDQILYFNNGSMLQSRLVGPDTMKKIEKGKLPRFLEKEWDEIIFDSEWRCGEAEDVEDYDLGDLDDLWFG